MPDKTTVLKQLRTIPGVGKAVASDLYNMGYRSVADLQGEDPDSMYVRHNDQKGHVQDICMLYTFRSAVYYADTFGGLQDPEKLKWWNWMDKQKVDSNTKDAQIRKKKNLT
jgi:Pathogenicity locus